MAVQVDERTERSCWLFSRIAFTRRRVARWGMLFAVVAAGWMLWRSVWVGSCLFMARRALDRADAESAWVVLTRAARVEPQRADVQFLLAKAARRSGRLAEASKHLQRAEQAGWAGAAVVREQHLIAVQGGQFDQSALFVRQLLAQGDPNEVEIFEACAKGYLQNYRLQEAMDCFAYWIARRPNDIQPHLWRAMAWERMRDRKKALADYQAAVRIKPDHWEARRNAANMLLECNRLQEATEEYELCRANDPGNPEVLLGLARCHRQLAQTARAREILQHLLTLDPDHSEGLTEMGQLELAENRFQVALTWLDRAVKQTPYNPVSHYALGQALARAGELQAAQEHFEQARRIQQDMARIDTIRQQLLTTPSGAELRYEAGMILIRNGQPAEGARWLLTALQYQPSHRATHQALAEYYEQERRMDLAAEHRRLATAKGEH